MARWWITFPVPGISRIIFEKSTSETFAECSLSGGRTEEEFIRDVDNAIERDNEMCKYL